jgi:hypothetical protein
MVRFLSLLGMAGGFLMISPQLRMSLFDSVGRMADTVERNSPYSYIGLGVVALGGMMIFVYKSSQPR